jgi:hypothetical protein
MRSTSCLLRTSNRVVFMAGHLSAGMIFTVQEKTRKIKWQMTVFFLNPFLYHRFDLLQPALNVFDRVGVGQAQVALTIISEG